MISPLEVVDLYLKGRGVNSEIVYADLIDRWSGVLFPDLPGGEDIVVVNSLYASKLLKLRLGPLGASILGIVIDKKLDIYFLYLGPSRINIGNLNDPKSLEKCHTTIRHWEQGNREAFRKVLYENGCDDI